VRSYVSSNVSGSSSRACQTHGMRHRRKLSNWQKAHRNLHHHLSQYRCKREGTSRRVCEFGRVKVPKERGGKWDEFRHCRSTVSYYFRRAYIHVVEYLIRVLIRLVCFQGDRRVDMLSEWELSRTRVRVHRPTSARCNIVEYVLMGG